MASMSVASLLLLLLVSSSCPVLQAQIIPPPIVKGLSYRFYKSKCPKLEKIVKEHLTTVFRKDIGQAAALLRIHFHDCFVQVTSLFFGTLPVGTPSDAGEVTKRYGEERRHARWVFESSLHQSIVSRGFDILVLFNFGFLYFMTQI